MSEHLVDAATFAGIRELIDLGLNPDLARRTAMALRPYYRAAVEGELSLNAWLLVQPALNGYDSVSVYRDASDFEDASSALMVDNLLHVGVRLGDAIAAARSTLDGGTHG